MVRFKNRYIVVEVSTTHDSTTKLTLKKRTLRTAIDEKIQQLFGNFGVAAVYEGLLVKFCNSHTSIAFIRARLGPHRIVASSLPFINELDRTRVTVSTLYTGASLEQCYKFLQKYQRSNLEKMWSRLTPMDKLKMEECLLE